MIMTERDEQLPRPAAELDQLAVYYESHDTSAKMEHGTWVEPQPMATISLRLPADVISQLKHQPRPSTSATQPTCVPSWSAPPTEACRQT